MKNNTIWHYFGLHKSMIEVAQRFMQSKNDLRDMYGENILAVRERVMEGRSIGCLLRWIAFLLIITSFLSFSGFIQFTKENMITPISKMFIGLFLLFLREWRIGMELKILEPFLNEFEELTDRLTQAIIESSSTNTPLFECATAHLIKLAKDRVREEQRGITQKRGDIDHTNNLILNITHDLVTLGYLGKTESVEYLERLFEVARVEIGKPQHVS